MGLGTSKLFVFMFNDFELVNEPGGWCYKSICSGNKNLDTPAGPYRP